MSGWHRALAVCSYRLGSEAGWKPLKAAWFPVEVTLDDRLRPVAAKVGDVQRQLEVMGALASGDRYREKVWRVRADTGVEAMLVREAGGAWYADEHLG